MCDRVYNEINWFCLRIFFYFYGKIETISNYLLHGALCGVPLLEQKLLFILPNSQGFYSGFKRKFVGPKCICIPFQKKKNHEHYLAFKVAIVLYFRSDHFEHDSKITQKSAAIISLRICRKRKENIILDKKNKIRSCTLYLISQSFQKCFLFSSKYLLSPS